MKFGRYILVLSRVLQSRAFGIIRPPGGEENVGVTLIHCFSYFALKCRMWVLVRTTPGTF